MSSASSFGKLNLEKNWQLKATYVEVCTSRHAMTGMLIKLTSLSRSTTSSSAICYSLTRLPPATAAL